MISFCAPGEAAMSSRRGTSRNKDPAPAGEARPCQRRGLTPQGRGTTAPPAVTSRCSSTGVPKANHDSFAATEVKLFAIFRRHGILGSDLYVCKDARIFKGFRDLRAALEAAPEEEVWVEIDRYRDQADSLRVIEGIGKDPEAGPLFGRVLRIPLPAGQRRASPCLTGRPVTSHVAPTMTRDRTIFPGRSSSRVALQRPGTGN